MGDPNTGEIYHSESGPRSPGDVPLTSEQAARLSGLDVEERKLRLQELATQLTNLNEPFHSETRPERTTPLGITDDLGSTRFILEEIIKAHQGSPKKSRQRSLLITKLEEARMWATEALLRE